MPKQMVSWRLEPELLKELETEAINHRMEVTELVEQKLGVPLWAEQMLTLLRRIDRKVTTASEN